MTEDDEELILFIVVKTSPGFACRVGCRNECRHVEFDDSIDAEFVDTVIEGEAIDKWYNRRLGIITIVPEDWS